MVLDIQKGCYIITKNNPSISRILKSIDHEQTDRLSWVSSGVIIKWRISHNCYIQRNTWKYCLMIKVSKPLKAGSSLTPTGKQKNSFLGITSRWKTWVTHRPLSPDTRIALANKLHPWIKTAWPVVAGAVCSAFILLPCAAAYAAVYMSWKHRRVVIKWCSWLHWRIWAV